MHNMERRRNYYINKEFQGRFILTFCLLVTIGSLISGFIIYSMSQATVTTTFENSKLTIKSTADFILPAVLLSSVIVIIAIGIATIAITLFTSHKIAGPLYRIDKDIKQITDGNLKIVFNLREKDEIRPIAESLNEMVRSVKEKITLVKQELTQIEDEVGKLPGQGSEKIKDHIKRAKSASDKFIT